MRTKHLTAAFLITLILSCKDTYEDTCKDMIWDFTNYEFFISVINESGENLLDPETKGNLLDGGVWITYKGETYNMKEVQSINTRYLPPSPLSLRYYPKNENNSNSLILGFGEFSPTENYKREEFTIHWEDGTNDKIEFDCYIIWEDDCEPEVQKALYLNGKQISAGEYAKVTIIKK